MMENIVLKEKLEKLFDRLTTEIVYTAWMNRIKFKDKSISELMILINKKDKNFTAKIFKKALVELQLLQNKEIELQKCSLVHSSIKFERAASIDTLGKYPLFIYNNEGKLIKIQYGKHCSLVNFTNSLLYVISKRLPSILDEIESKKVLSK